MLQRLVEPRQHTVAIAGCGRLDRQCQLRVADQEIDHFAPVHLFPAGQRRRGLKGRERALVVMLEQEERQPDHDLRQRRGARTLSSRSTPRPRLIGMLTPIGLPKRKAPVISSASPKLSGTT